jgi:hypothetical protein
MPRASAVTCPMVTIHHDALPAAQFRRLLRRVRLVGTERLRHTYQTTFWFDLSEPTSVVEEAILALRPRLPSPRGIHGVEWWLSRMRATDVKVDFHRDRDEKRALRGGSIIHPRFSSVLFMNRVRGGLLAITEEPPCEENPAKAPARLDLALVAPRPNRFVVFRGDLTHGVLDAENAIPEGALPGPARLRVAVIMNWWQRRPLDVPSFARARVYQALRL